VVSLAKSDLRQDWRRYVPVVFALAFSALLIDAQLGLALGWCHNQTRLLNSTSADLLFSSPKVKTYSMAGGVSEDKELLLRQHEEVAAIQPQCRIWGNIRNGSSEDSFCVIYALVHLNEPDLLFPPEFVESFGAALEEPMTVVLERNYSRRLGIQTGDKIEINNKRVTVVGFTEFSTMVKYYGFAVASMTTMRLLSSGGKNIEYYLVRLKNPERKEALGPEIAQLTNDKLKSWTPAELNRASQYYILFQSPKSLQMIFSTVLSALIGIVITNQALRGAILASLREYAAIRALGVSRRSLNLVILEQSFWLGLSGVTAGLLMTGVVAWAAYWCGLPFYLPIPVLAVLSLFIITVALVSGGLAMRVLYRTQPAELLR